MITLDFTFKKVRRNGKSMTKFDIAFLLDSIVPRFPSMIIYDFCSYQELAYFLKKFALEKLHTKSGDKIMVIE